jgi:hypothetical protein
MKLKLFFLLNLCSLSMLVFSQNPVFNPKIKILSNLGMSGLSFMNTHGIKLGALTPSVICYYKGKYSLGAEYFNFGQYYFNTRYTMPPSLSGKEKWEVEKHGYTHRIYSQNYKLMFGYLMGLKHLYINPYASLNYRYSKLGHEFTWQLDDNNFTGANSSFNSIGTGLGVSINSNFLKYLNLSLDFSYTHFYDKSKITSNDVSQDWPRYKPLNNLLVIQLKMGILL